MDRGTAIDRLPEAYANALRLCDQGHDNEAIAARLHLAPEAVGPLLRLAAAKLQTILAANEASHDLVPESDHQARSRPARVKPGPR
jgi:DNA-directed RNA polymerase specialized sigma24 family protein